MATKCRHPLPIVGQNRPTLPDGTVDPAHATDCGESCLSCVLLAFDVQWLSPGCIRESMGLARSSGISTGAELAEWLGPYPLDVQLEQFSGDRLLTELQSAYSTGGCAIVLGEWYEPGLYHWMVSGENTREGCWFMDPWSATHQVRKWDSIKAVSGNSQVFIHGR